MSNDLPWLNFLNAVTIIIGAIYLFGLILLFIIGTPPNNVTNTSQPAVGHPGASNMMGPVKPDFKVNRNSPTAHSSQVMIAQEDQSIRLDVQVRPNVSDLLKEIKSLTTIIQESNMIEEESLTMYKTLITKNAHLESSSYKEAINMFIHDQCTNVCGFQIEISDIRSWWIKNKS